MNAIWKCHRRFQDAINNVIALALALLLLVILLQTFTRYVVFYSLPWSEELSRYLYVLLILLGINIGVANDGFVRIDLIDFFIADKSKRALAFFRDAVTLFVSGVFFYSSIGLVRIGAFQKSPAMQIRMHYIYMVLLVGFLLCLLSAVLRLAGWFRRDDSEKPGDAGARPAEGGTN